MLAEGVPLAVISQWLGHSGIAITASHYAAVVPTLQRDAAAAMDRALGETPATGTYHHDRRGITIVMLGPAATGGPR